MAGFERPTQDDVEFDIEKKVTDTIVVGFGDTHGRLVVRRVPSELLRSFVLGSGLRVPGHLLATDATGQIAPGFAVSSLSSGFRDIVLRADTSTLYRMPWLPGSVGILGDLEFVDGTAVAVSPRTVLKRQVARLEANSLTGMLGTEPEFVLIENGSRSDDAPRTRHESSGANYLSSRSARVEPLMRRIRRALTEMPVAHEGTVGLSAPGHFEVPVLPGDIVMTCDRTVVLRDVVKEIATQEGFFASFMAVPDLHGCSAGHVSISLRGLRGGSTFADRHGDATLSEAGKSWLAGQLAHTRELFLLYAPNPNSYRRFALDPMAPTALNWGYDNRTCAFRVAGVDTTMRIENRIPGSDANPYLAAAATIAAGLDGLTRQLTAPGPAEGDGHHSSAEPLPTSLSEALAAWTASDWVRTVFGPETQDHYANMARLEIEAAGAADDLDLEHERYFTNC